jgi:Flp pilus assembly protein TadD
MARAKTPDPLKRRHLLEEALAPARALAVADAYLAEGRRFDALAFLAKADAKDRLRALLGEAVADGDLFLARETAALLGEPPDARTWRELAAAAEAAGRERYAVEARRLADARSGERAKA